LVHHATHAVREAIILNPVEHDRSYGDHALPTLAPGFPVHDLRKTLLRPGIDLAWFCLECDFACPVLRLRIAFRGLLAYAIADIRLTLRWWSRSTACQQCGQGNDLDSVHCDHPVSRTQMLSKVAGSTCDRHHTRVCWWRSCPQRSPSISQINPGAGPQNLFAL